MKQDLNPDSKMEIQKKIYIVVHPNMSTHIFYDVHNKNIHLSPGRDKGKQNLTAFLSWKKQIPSALDSFFEACQKTFKNIWENAPDIVSTFPYVKHK